MHYEDVEATNMIETLIAIVGTLLLINAARPQRRPVPVPVRANRPKR
jgi:hypothetical protein